MQSRYRNSLDDLAHSLKTPLALMQSFCERKSEQLGDEHALVREQVQRMDGIIEHQLQRAAVSGRAALARSVPLAPVLERLLRSLDKVYREKQVDVALELDAGATFYGDEADLTEVLGNLLDNAYKYCSRTVQVRARGSGRAASPAGLEITIEDDGQGIKPELTATVLQRGRRADETVPGHGIGLSMAREIIDVYGGQLEIAASRLGGAMIRVRFNS